VFFVNKIACPQSDLNTEPSNLNADEQEIISNVDNSTDDYFLLVNEQLLDCVRFTNNCAFSFKHQSSYFGTHFQLLPASVPEVNYETQLNNIISAQV
jgi:hypothetical protein